MTNRKIKVISATFGYIESMDKLIQYLADKGFDLENTTHPQWELVKELDNWIEVEYDEKNMELFLLIIV
jgi:hypothetical protein